MTELVAHDAVETGEQVDTHTSVMGFPKLMLAGLLSMSAGELVWRLWFHEAAV